MLLLASAAPTEMARIEPTATIPVPAGSRAGAARGPVMIEVRDLHKSFRIPLQRVDTLKERAVRALSPTPFRELRALRGISFDVHRGEFLAIVGRNGSGKSTLLKILSSIYAPDRGRVRMAGTLAPFVELGVGINPELTARENILLNGVLLGLSRRETRRRQDAVLDFAELREFVDLKLKNYSSGMMVRLAFAIMIQADAEIMLVDEVLAVGDAAFGQKCMDAFHERRAAGRTIVLVTHDMATVQSLCHRALLIEDGVIKAIGGPEDVALEYYRLNYADELEPRREREARERRPQAEPVGVDINARAVEAKLLDDSGRPAINIELGRPFTIDVTVQAAQRLDSPRLLVHLVNAEHAVVTELERTLPSPLRAGERVRIKATITNRLVPGRYFVDLWVGRGDPEVGDAVTQGMRLLHFSVFGAGSHPGVVAPRSTVRAALLGPTPGG
jgi:ABC-2 type transport system ATP-binding protein